MTVELTASGPPSRTDSRPRPRAAVSNFWQLVTSIIILAPLLLLFSLSIGGSSDVAEIRKLAKMSTSASVSTAATTRGPVYFISHGGPPTLFATDTEPWKAWERVGKRIQEDVKEGRIARDKGLICVSAHWEAEDQSGKTIEVNVDSSNPLIFDFYGFPKILYEQKYLSRTGPTAHADLKAVIEEAGFNVQEAKRGLDHGLWIPFKVLFPGSDAEVDVSPPITQISLPGDSTEETSERLGRAIGKLREKGYGVLTSGQAVHNLRAAFGRQSLAPSESAAQDQAFASFFKAFKSAVTTDGTQGPEAIREIFHHPSYKIAQPTPEHLLPVLVAGGAVASAGSYTAAETIFEMNEGALGWAMLRWD